MKFHEQLLKDLKASAPKSAALGLLLLVGSYFWLPQLVRAFSDSTPATPTTAAATSTTTTPTPADSTGSNTTTPKKPRDSAAMTKLLKENPLMQSADIDQLPQKPFGIDEDQFPLPVLFADENETDAAKKNLAETPKLTDKLTGLVLKSMVVGTRRRAAMINNRLFQEGQSVPWNGLQLQLTNVQRKSVTLKDGSREWKLVLDDPHGDDSSNNQK